MLFLCLAKINNRQKVQSEMSSKRQQSIISYLNSQIEPKKALKKLEGSNYETDLCFTQHSKKSNASEERQQFNAIEKVLNNFFKGEAVVRQLIAKIDNSTIRDQFDKITVQYFKSKDSLKQKEKDINNAMAEFNHHLYGSLKNQWPYSFKLKHSSQLINYGVLKDILKDLNEHKICKLIIKNHQQLKFNEYSDVLRSDSFSFLTKVNKLVSNKVSKTLFESDFLHSLKQINEGKYKEDQSIFRPFNKQIHQQLVRLGNLVKPKNNRQSTSGFQRHLSPSKSSLLQEQQLSKDKKQFVQIEQIIQGKYRELQRANKQVESISRKRVEIKNEIDKQQIQLKTIIQKANILRHKYKSIEVLQEEKKALQNTIDQLTKQHKNDEQRLRSIISNLQEQDIKKNKSTNFYKQQLRDKERQLSQFDFEYQSLKEKYIILTNQKEQLFRTMSIAKQESLKGLETREVKVVQQLSQKQAALAELREQCSKKDQVCKRINITLAELIKQKQEDSKIYQKLIAEKDTLLIQKEQQIKGLTDQNDLFVRKEQKLQRIIEGKQKQNQDLLKKLNEKTDQRNQIKQQNMRMLKQKENLKIQKEHALTKLKHLQQSFSDSKEQVAIIESNLLDFKQYLNRELMQYAKASESLVSQNKYLKQNLEQMMKEIDKSTIVDIDQAGHQILQQKIYEISKLNQMIDQMKALISQRDRQLQSKQDEKEKNYLLKQQNQNLQRIVNEIYAQREEEKLILQSLRGQIERLNKEQKSSQSLIKNAQKQFANLLAKQNQEKEKTISQLKQRLLQENTEKDIQYMKKINSMTVTNNYLTKENESNLQKIASMESKMNNISSQNQRLTANNVNLSAQNDRLSGEMQAIQKYFDELSQKFNIIIKENKQLQQKYQLAQAQNQLLKQYKADFQQLQNESSFQVNRNKQLEKQISQFRQQLIKQKESSSKMACLAQENSNHIERIQSENQQLQKELTALKAKESNKSTFTPEQKRKLQKKLRQYQQQIEELTRQINYFNQNMEEVTRMNLENDLQAVKADKLKHQQEIAKMEQLCQQLTKQNNSKVLELQQKQQQINRLRKEAEQLRENIRGLLQKMSTPRQPNENQIEELENKLNAKEQQHAQTSKKYKDSMAQCDLLNAKFEAIQSQYYEMKKGINSQISQMGSSDIVNDLLFQNDVLEGKIGHKKYLRQTIQDHMGFKIWKSRLIFRFDVQNKVNFHRYIDGKENLVIVMKLKNGNYLATYTEGSFQPQKVSTQEALIISLTNQETFKLIDKNKRAITYDQYFLIFGNSEIRIRSQENKVFSNFAITNGYFETRGKKVPILLGGGPSDRQLQFQHYEIYQLEVLYDL